jgi:uncharacterized ion transporter superfamily protein YfcC
MIRAASIVFFVFIMGGSFTMITGDGGIDAGIAKVITRFKDRDKLVIPSSCSVLHTRFHHRSSRGGHSPLFQSP